MECHKALVLKFFIEFFKVSKKIIVLKFRYAECECMRKFVYTRNSILKMYFNKPFLTTQPKTYLIQFSFLRSQIYIKELIFRTLYIFYLCVYIIHTENILSP